MKDEFVDKDLGRVCVLRNARAKSVIARRKADYIQLTVPTIFPMARILEVFAQLKPRLAVINTKPVLYFTPQLVFEALTFTLKIENRNVKNYHAKLEHGVLTIDCPNVKDFADASVQLIIRNCVENALRYEAKRVLLDMLCLLAKKYGFTFTALKINKSTSRWGSCNFQKSINLSYFCLLLPQHLIHFVLLHELCHTVEMNHGNNFWKLLDSVTHGKARELTLELRKTSIQW